MCSNHVEHIIERTLKDLLFLSRLLLLAFNSIRILPTICWHITVTLGEITFYINLLPVLALLDIIEYAIDVSLWLRVALRWIIIPHCGVNGEIIQPNPANNGAGLLGNGPRSDDSSDDNPGERESERGNAHNVGPGNGVSQAIGNSPAYEADTQERESQQEAAQQGSEQQGDAQEEPQEGDTQEIEPQEIEPQEIEPQEIEPQDPKERESQVGVSRKRLSEVGTGIEKRLQREPKGMHSPENLVQCSIFTGNGGILRRISSGGSATERHSFAVSSGTTPPEEARQEALAESITGQEQEGQGLSALDQLRMIHKDNMGTYLPGNESASMNLEDSKLPDAYTQSDTQSGAKLDTKPDTTPDAQPDAMLQTMLNTMPDNQPDAMVQTMLDNVLDTLPDTVPDTKPGAK